MDVHIADRKHSYIFIRYALFIRPQDGRRLTSIWKYCEIPHTEHVGFKNNANTHAGIKM